MVNKATFTFFYDRPFKIFMAIGKTKGCYASKILRDIKCTYSHSNKIINDLYDRGLITKTVKGRVMILDYTEKGYDLYCLFKKVKLLL